MKLVTSITVFDDVTAAETHLLLELCHVDIALSISADCDDLHAGHDSTGRVGAMG